MFEILKFIWFLLRALLLLLWEEKRKLWLYLHNTVNPSLVSRVLLTALKSFKKKTPKYNGPYKAKFRSFRYGVGHNRLI
jgi:hypothetical protein